MAQPFLGGAQQAQDAPRLGTHATDGQALHLDRARRGARLAREGRQQLVLTIAGHAAAPDMTLTENALLSGAVRKGLIRRGMIDWPGARAFADAIIARFDVRTPGTEVAARALSGGNLQKFVIGREIMQGPKVLVVNQPTWGVDAQAAAAIRQALLTLADDGAAVIVISQDLDEVLQIADRFAALNEGRLSPPRPVRGLTLDEVGLMLGGAHDMDVAAPDAVRRTEEITHALD